MAESKISRVYKVFAEHPSFKDVEVAEVMGDITEDMVCVYRHRLKNQGYVEFNPTGGVNILKPYKGESKGLKQRVYEEMVDTYMDDFRAQQTFADRLAVGREIRLILEKM
ncbi:MAG: hypothetical protein ACLT4X_02870 [Phascolarctobacterium sp.]|jgi:hypothetical protein|nr:MAG TPA: dissimilatory sulfite reductase D [Caudoviricetes sp.]